MQLTESKVQFAICTAGDEDGDLEAWKVYRMLPDKKGDKIVGRIDRIASLYADSRPFCLSDHEAMREISKPSTVQCNSTLYTLFLLSEPKYVSCVRLSEILAEVSHDSMNHFLLRERYTPKGLLMRSRAS